MPRILVLKGRADSKYTAVDGMARRWIRAGHRVMTRYGLGNLPAADVLFVHVDTTCTPREYREVFCRYGVVINGRALDVDKSLYSRARLRQSDDYEGPVIVKTRANFGGEGDERYRIGRFLRYRALVRWHHRFSELFEQDWRRRRTLTPHDYPIFDRRRDVPDDLWQNQQLIVERFCPERQGDLYFVRYWIFFGERGWARRFGSKSPIVKFGNRVTDEEAVTVPRELIELRQRLGLDYGRIDFVQHGDVVTVFDVNKTLGAGRNSQGFEAELDYLAGEIENFMEERGNPVSSDDDQIRHYARVWRNLTVPVRPSEGVLRVYRDAMAKLPEKKVLIFGCTPELVDMAVAAGAARIVSIERSPTVIKAFQTLGQRDWSGVQFIVGNWLEDRAEFHGGFNCVMCDGGVMFLEYPGQWSQLFEIVHGFLAPQGVFVGKSWAEPAGDRNYEDMVEAHIGAFKAASPGLNADEYREAFVGLATTLRLVTFVHTTRADSSFDQKLLVERADDLMHRLEKEFPDPAMVEINHAALKYLARSQPGRADTVSGAGYDRAEPLLREKGFEPQNFALSDPPIDGSTYVFVARRVSN
jgi:hypothetical protein